MRACWRSQHNNYICDNYRTDTALGSFLLLQVLLLLGIELKVTVGARVAVTAIRAVEETRSITDIAARLEFGDQRSTIRATEKMTTRNQRHLQASEHCLLHPNSTHAQQHPEATNTHQKEQIQATT